MDKIGLLTFATNTNYGSWCLTWALYKAIKKLGYDIEIIDYHYEECEVKENVNLGTILESMYSWRGDTAAIKKLINKKKVQIGLDKDRKKFWGRSARRYTSSDIEKANEVYDVFMIGADQVWDHRFAGKSLDFYLDFVNKNKKKIAYAAGTGYTDLSFGSAEKKEYTDYLTDFEYIAVRERNLKDFIQESCGRNVPIVCDPTMLLKNSEWRKFVGDNLEKKPYVLLYIVDYGRMHEIARHYAKRHGCKVIYIGYDQPNKYVETRQPKSISEWLTLIYYAEKVFTGSYHGLLFSVYFSKEFSYYNRRPLARFTELSERLMIDRYEIHHESFDVEKCVDWEKVKMAEEGFREHSNKVLLEAMYAANL